MTSFFPFIPSYRQAPQFTPTLDGQPYIITVLWNISAQRYYINCKNISGKLIFMIPLVENAQPIPIQSLEFDQQNHWVKLTTVAQHGFPIGKAFTADIIDCTPSGYNGHGIMAVLSTTEITYPMLVDPGQPTVLGAIDKVVSLTQGYFLSTMVFRNNVFEINP